MTEQETPGNPPGLIYKELPAMIGELAPVAKDKKNTIQNYKFRSIDDVYGTLKDGLAKHSLCIVPYVLEHHDEQYASSKGTMTHRVTLLVEFKVCAADGSFITARVRSEGVDNSDKASGKAMTFAFKSLCWQVFCIAVAGEVDPDSESPTIPAQAARQPTPAAPPAPPKPTRAEKLAKLRAAFPGDNEGWLVGYFKDGMQDPQGNPIAWLGPDEGLDQLDDKHLDACLRRLKGLGESVQKFADQNQGGVTP